MSVRASTRTSAPVEAVTPATGDTSDTALYQLKRFSEAADKIRANATTAAKTLGGLGTAGIAAVGVAKFSDVFPLPGNGDGRAVLLAIAVIVGFALMLGAVLLLTGRMWQVGEPVFTTSDVDTMVRMRAVTERETPAGRCGLSGNRRPQLQAQRAGRDGASPTQFSKPGSLTTEERTQACAATISSSLALMTIWCASMCSAKPGTIDTKFHMGAH